MRSKLGSGDTLMSAMTHLPDSNAQNACNAALPSDRDLLRRFIHDGDEASFAAIVERHASLVMSVCRRVVGQSPDVDDAFQATFFALSQRPASIFECLSLTGWLYSVAWRASVRLVRMRKRTMTQPLPDQVPASEPDPLDVIAQASDLASLDEELNQLPQKYRDVIVMSYFAQQTNQEIADQLNESKGAIDGRIRDARRMLRVRLARRGVEVGVLAVATAYVQSTASAASPALIQKAISLGAPGLASQELAALDAAEVAQMKLLTSTGIPIMSKIGLTIAAGLVLATSVWGMTKLAAIQNGEGERSGGDAVAVDAKAGDSAESTENNAVISGRAATAADPINVDAATPSVVPPTVSNPADSNASEAFVRKTLTSSPRATGEFSRLSEREADKRTNEMMHEDITAGFDFPGDNPLRDILELLSHASTEAYGVRLSIYPDHSALAAGDVVFEEVMIKDIEIENGSMTIGSFLDFVLSQTDPKLTWIVKDGLLLITRENAAESDEYMMLRSYDISRLREALQLNMWFFHGGQGGMYGPPIESNHLDAGLGRQSPTAGQDNTPPTKPATQKITRMAPQKSMATWESGLLQTIESLCSPPCRWFDIDGEGGRMSIAGNRLLVRQTRKGHEHVVAVLEQLELAADENEAAQ